jgi:hypothetical protein
MHSNICGGQNEKQQHCPSTIVELGKDTAETCQEFPYAVRVEDQVAEPGGGI